MKVASTVRRGEVGKGLAEIPLGEIIFSKQVKRTTQYLAGPLPYKTTGWKLEPDGKHITFTDGCGIGTLRLVGNKKQSVETFPVQQIKRVRIVKRADGYYCQFAVEAHRRVDHAPTNQARGIDVGLKSYYTDSDGKMVANPAISAKPNNV